MKIKTSYTYVNNEFKDFIKDMLKNNVLIDFLIYQLLMKHIQ